MLSTVIRDLNTLRGQTPSKATSLAAIHLLELLPVVISEEEREDILVPDKGNRLLPLNSVHYNDIGDRACLIGSSDVHTAHPDLHEDLAKKLGMSRLGWNFAALKKPGRDMGEQTTTTIRNRLREYTEQQLLTEFVANAVDAGATEFGILVDELQNTGKETLFREMDKFQACQSLVIHNNALFTDKDFDGICNTGIGGKQSRTDSIGQFGSGALTMFHFSEVGPTYPCRSA